MPKVTTSLTNILNRMRREHLTMHAEHNRRRGRIVWHLSNGTEIPDTLARELIRHPNIAPAGDALPFGRSERLPSQTNHFYI
jgi:hypothetical protein